MVMSFLTQRNNYGNITYFTSEQEIDQKDHLLSAGILYKFRENVYATLITVGGVQSFLINLIINTID